MKTNTLRRSVGTNSKRAANCDAEHVRWTFERLLELSAGLDAALASYERENGRTGLTLSAIDGLAYLRDFAAVCGAGKGQRRAAPLGMRIAIGEIIAEHRKEQANRTPAEVRMDNATDRAMRRVREQMGLSGRWKPRA